MMVAGWVLSSIANSRDRRFLKGVARPFAGPLALVLLRYHDLRVEGFFRRESAIPKPYTHSLVLAI